MVAGGAVVAVVPAVVRAVVDCSGVDVGVGAVVDVASAFPHAAKTSPKASTKRRSRDMITRG